MLGFTVPTGGEITAAYARRFVAPNLNYYSPENRRTMHGLEYFRFNRAVTRGMYTLPFREQLSGMGDTISADPSLLFSGIGLLALGMFFFGKQTHSRRRRR